VARIRSIKPEFFTSETLARVPKSARLTFIGLWTYVDDNGVGPDNFRLITAALYPLEEDVSGTLADVIEELRTLENVGVIQRYSVAGKRFLFIKSWDEHQKISHPAKPRFWRPMPGDGNPPGARPAVTFGTAPESLRQSSGDSPETLPGAKSGGKSDERLILDGHSGHSDTADEWTGETAGQSALRRVSGDLPEILRPEQGAGSREQGKEQGNLLLNSPTQPPLLTVVPSEPLAPLAEKRPDLFDEFWSAYPRHVGKAKAKSTFATKVKNGADPTAVVAAARSYADRCRTTKQDPQFIPHPTTWLNRESWTDDLDEALPPAATGTGGYQPYRNDPNRDYSGRI
jgi:hypothetical protein